MVEVQSHWVVQLVEQKVAEQVVVAAEVSFQPEGIDQEVVVHVQYSVAD